MNGKTPVILVARGCLAPYFLNWWKARPNPLFVLDFSRWRWFDYGNPPSWIGATPPAGEVILFDRNTSTGQTLRLLKRWLEGHGYAVTVMGHVERRVGAFGVRFLDWVWDDSGGFNPVDLAITESNGVRLARRDEFLRSNPLRSFYTFAVVGGRREELQGFPCPEEVHVRLLSHGDGSSIVYQNVPDWRTAMILGYVEQKPLITVAGAPGIVADYAYGEDLTEVLDFLAQERRLA